MGRLRGARGIEESKDLRISGSGPCCSIEASAGRGWNSLPPNPGGGIRADSRLFAVELLPLSVRNYSATRNVNFAQNDNRRSVRAHSYRIRVHRWLSCVVGWAPRV